MNNNIDNKDLKILQILQKNGKITNKKLSDELNLSPPSVLERVKRLENSGYIKEYKAILDRDKIGRPILAFICIYLEKNNEETVNSLFKYLINLNEVLEIFHITGRFDFIVKVSAKNLQDLNKVISAKISESEAVKKVETFLVLDAFERNEYPIEIGE
ncbi:MAG: Lrp/AsnC family transcriptional regulator [Spirochaetes bacterium]|nr:Lrp/AsnC family transcriptional regulator [Spirochaetota bacterium]